jgi:arginase
MDNRIQIISAPSILGLKPTGVELLAQSLLDSGFLDSIRLNRPVIEIPTLNTDYDSYRDPETKCLNPSSIRDFSKSLMTQIAEEIDSSSFPVVLGGDCSILIGIMPALKSRGNFGLIFIDAHADFYEPEKSITGEVADMDLAIVTGRGPDFLTNIDNLRPYVKDINVIQIGQRDEEETKKYGSQDIRKTEITVFDLPTIRSLGLGKVKDDTIAQMEKLDVDGFWLHFDADVINDNENPAVEYRLPGGLGFKETEQLLKQLIQTGKIVGMNVTIFNPLLDKTGGIASKIAKTLSFGLTPLTS